MEHAGIKPDKKLILLILAAMLVILNIGVINDCRLYSQPICRIIKIKTTQLPDVSGDLGTKEKAYSQELTCKVLNSSDRGKTFVIKNWYTFSRYNDTKYHKGDELFLREITKNTDGTIKSTVIDGQKRDYFLSILVSAVIFGALLTAGRRGAAFALALAANIGVLAAGFACFQTGMNFILITAVFVIVFPFISLVMCIGWNRRMLASMLDTYLTIGVLTVVYCLFRRLSPDLDYTLQDYVRNGSLDIDTLLSCGTLIGSLGAIMDTAVSVTSGAAEMISRRPDISVEELAASLHNISLDVMGTMINVLFYTYMAGRIPMCIAQLANGMPVYVMFRYYMPFEVIRFLTGAVGIALCIIASEKVILHWYDGKKVTVR